MNNFIKRVGTTYIPVVDPEKSSKWYQEMLGAVENFRNDDKAILEFADQSFFLVKAQVGERSSFFDSYQQEHFTMTFEVDGIEQLIEFHEFLKKKEVSVGEIEDRGHPGNNFVFRDLDGNVFDVWSELSPTFKVK
ncbi:Catechol 2,3-dioxygenase [Paenisporosarcina quisquiliarum]|uniref:VOC family protein n=1 Tax=Psychrobacillus psychrodurans TaxID=126157 RepID=UPI0008C1677D|nr:VOC family protein [Psychrobacillus psychrodurans]MCK1996761.1 VOC family protein [Psychrobacillus psychrodurans]SEM58717.1 Catechol 2,3-dioxygenase [Paenisporosarcina quisquiliarum]